MLYHLKFDNGRYDTLIDTLEANDLVLYPDVRRGDDPSTIAASIAKEFGSSGNKHTHYLMHEEFGSVNLNESH